MHLESAPGLGRAQSQSPQSLGVLSAALKAALRVFQATGIQPCCHLDPEAEALVRAQQDRQLLVKRLSSLL